MQSVTPWDRHERQVPIAVMDETRLRTRGTMKASKISLKRRLARCFPLQISICCSLYAL